LRVILKLSRWQEFIPFTIPVTLLGGLMAYRFFEDEGVRLDIRLLTVLLANCLTVGYAFMINDIEDAEDDKHEPIRAERNAVAMGEISPSQAWLASFATAGLAAVLFALSGWAAFICGMVTLILAHLYSWKPVRLKALPIVDLVSHVLMLAALLMLAPYLVYKSQMVLEVWCLLAAVTAISAYGQLYNQVRDYEADRAAGLKNTASILGKSVTQGLSYLSIGVAVLGFAVPILREAFPIWLAGVLVAIAPIAYVFGKGKDMRGDDATDVIGEGQVQFLIAVNLLMIVWVVYVLATQ
jgi:4-hydroxybenzoate polyprenyltransferase